MMKLAKAAFLLIILSTNNAFAYQFMVEGKGNSSCGTWTEDRANGDDAAIAVIDETWVYGYVSGVENAVGALEKRNFTITTDADGISAWIDNYCHANPTDTISDAAREFVLTSGTVVPTN